MRAVFGLVGILGSLIAIIVFWNYAYLPYTQQVVSNGKSAQEQAEQIAGVDSTTGGRVSNSVAFDSVMVGGKLRGLRVKSIMLGSSYQTHYGIQSNDIIERIGPQNVRDIDDAEMAKALAYEAYQRQWELGIVRNDQHLTLPQQQVSAPFAPAPPSGAAPGRPAATPGNQQPAPAPARSPQEMPLQRQLDAIRNYGQ